VVFFSIRHFHAYLFCKFKISYELLGRTNFLVKRSGWKSFLMIVSLDNFNILLIIRMKLHLNLILIKLIINWSSHGIC